MIYFTFVKHKIIKFENIELLIAVTLKHYIYIYCALTNTFIKIQFI